MQFNYKTSLLAVWAALCCIQPLMAQDDNAEMVESKPRKWPFHAELGVNASGLVRLALSPSFADSATSALVNPYMLNARVAFGNVGLHAAAGGKYKQTLDAIEGFRDTKTETNQQLDWRAGLDYRVALSSRFSATFGADYAYSYRLSEVINDSGFDVIERVKQTTLQGGGLTVNLAYWFSPRFGLMTESNFFWMTGTVDNARRFKNFPELDDTLVEQDFTELRTLLPASLFVVFKF
jgi:hypothetical protein